MLAIHPTTKVRGLSCLSFRNFSELLPPKGMGLIAKIVKIHIFIFYKYNLYIIKIILLFFYIKLIYYIKK